MSSEEFELFDHPILTEQDMEDMKLKEGEYPFTTIEARGATSEAGNKMVVLKLKITGLHNRTHNLTDWLVASDFMAGKIKHFWESVGFADRYKVANRVDDYNNKSGHVLLKSQKNRKTGEYEVMVKDYIVKDPTLDDKITF